VGALKKAVGTLACLALIVGLFPTFRAILHGPNAVSIVAPAPPASGGDPLVAATQAAENAPPGSLRVMLVGNSVADLLAPGFRAVTSPQVAVLDASVDGCGFPPGLGGVHITLPDGVVLAQPPCDPIWEAGEIARFRPSLIFWIVSDPVGTGGVYQGHTARPCSAVYDALYRDSLTREVAVLHGGGAEVVIPTEAYSRYLGTAKYDRATDCQNMVRRAVAISTGATLVDLFSYVCPHGQCRVEQNGVTLRPDGLHYSGAGGVLVARWLMAQVKPRG
jgi:hypothetical protein